MPRESIPGPTGASRRYRCSRRTHCIVLFAIVLAAIGSAPVAADVYTSEGQPPLPSVTLVIGDAALSTELAISAEQRYRGLGNRRALERNAAMLFVYAESRMLTFTMRDTRLPLSIAYLSDAAPGSADQPASDTPAGSGERPGTDVGTRMLVINEIIDMDVGPGQLFPATRLARYALEVNQGWFGERGIEAGDLVQVELGTLR